MVSYKYPILIFILGIGQVLTAQYTPPAYNSSMEVNYIHSWDAKRPLTDPALVTSNTNIREVNQSTQYFDGLGRLLQTVNKQFSPNQNDMVTARVYDSFGRETYSFLPFTSNTATAGDVTNDGKFKIDPFQQEAAFYNTYLSGQSESYYYSLNNYELSSLNRVAETYAPGKNWAGTSGAPVESNRHGVDIRYAINTADDSVKYWAVTDGSPGTFGSYAASNYAAGALNKLITEDEQGGQTIEFKDKEGRVVLKKVLLTATRDLGAGGHGHAGWMNTYYIYDLLGRLRCVLQPEGTKKFIETVTTGSLTDAATLNEQCFRYEYDARNRMIMKKVPGTGSVEMICDQRDRLVMSRDSSLRIQNY